MKKWKLVYQCIIPMIAVFSLALYASYRQSAASSVLVAIAMLAYVWLVPACDKRENLWMFFLVMLYGTPMNISFIHRNIVSGRVLYNLFLQPMAYVIMVSAEEIVMGGVVRTIWRRQYRLPYSGE